MKETRRLDVLAIIGGVLAVVILTWLGILAYTFHSTHGFDDYWARDECIRRAPLPEMKADLDAMLPPPGLSTRPDLARLVQAGHSYPNDPRLNLHMGLFAEEPMASRELEHLSKLDADNSLPLYLLAGKAASAGSWEEALGLMKEASRRPKLEFYDYSYRIAQGEYEIEEKLQHTDSNASNRVFAILRKLAHNSSDRALTLHRQCKDEEALALLADVREIGKRLDKREKADFIGVLVGNGIVKTCDMAGFRIASDIGDQNELARIKSDAERSLYLRAGATFYMDSSIDTSIGNMVKVVLMGAVTLMLLGCQALIMLIFGIGALWENRRSGDVESSALHRGATQVTYSTRRLATTFAVVLGVGCLPTIIVLAVPATMSGSTVLISFLASAVPFILTVFLDLKCGRAYKKAYQRLAEEAGAEPLPKKWTQTSRADAREMTRRSAGLSGGFLITLSIWAVLLSIGLKLHFNAYPWQITKAMGGMPQAEMKYVKDLVDGKIKVPQKYIDQVKRDEAQRNVQRSRGIVR